MKYSAVVPATPRNPDDPRVQRTRAALLMAFNRLVLEQGYDHLTPAMIASAAGVGRSTFYEHHASKDALLRHSITPLLQPLVDATVGRDAPELEAVLRHFWERRRLAARLLVDRPGAIIRDHLANLTTSGLRAIGSASAIPLPLMAIGHASAQLALISEWVSGRHQCSGEQLACALREQRSSRRPS